MARKRASTSKEAGRITGARTAGLPAFVEPELATLVKDPPAGDAWLHEMKLDGYRILCRIDNGKVKLYSRNRNDWTTRFESVAKAAAQLPVKTAWLDGEVVVLLPNGLSSFQALQNSLSGTNKHALQYYVFDLPYLDGYDLRDVELLGRKTRLEKLLQRPPASIRYTSHVIGNGQAFFEQACRLKLEGMIAKRATSIYRAGRGRDWVKVKCLQRQEMVIGGFTDPEGSRQGFGALLLGVYEKDGSLRYSGKVGTGFNEKFLVALRKKLDTMLQPNPAFANPPRGAEARRAHWIKPDLVAEVAFTEWTDEGTLRHPSFLGLREDKPARSITREKPAELITTTLQAPPGRTFQRPRRKRGAPQSSR